MKPRKIIRIVDDYGEHTYTVSSERDGCYYFYQKTLDGWRLRYNPREERIEHYNPKGFWDVENQYLYDVQICVA